MGRIKIQATVKHGKNSNKISMQVDSGADATMISFDQACRLGLNTETAQIETITAMGGAKVRAYVLKNVDIKVNRRQATLDEVYVPAMRMEGKQAVSIRKDDESLLGHDFMQKSNSILDFETHELRGLGKAVSLKPKFSRRPATATEAAQVRMVASCPTTISRRRK